jgi:hypothetical protein
MSKSIFLGFAAGMLCTTTWAAATTPLDVKPGQWETTTTSETAGQLPIPQEMLDKMPPEQRARMEQAMKARAAKGATTRTRKSCVRKEQLDKIPFSADDDGKSCKPTVETSSRTKQEIHMDCENEAGKRTGFFRVEAADPESVKGTVQMTVSNGGRTMNINSNFSAKWLGPVCTESGK